MSGSWMSTWTMMAVGLLMISCGGEGGTSPSAAAQNLCSTLMECADELDHIDEEMEEMGEEQCAQEIEEEIDWLADGDDTCARGIAGMYDCLADQPCSVLAELDEGLDVCEQEAEQAEEMCEDDGNGSSASGHPSAEAFCQWEVDCGYMAQSDYEDCVIEGTEAYNEASASCVSAMEFHVDCVTALECHEDPFGECESELEAVENDCH